MALEKNVVSLPFLDGIDEKSSGKTIKPGALLSAENVHYEKTGQIKKREGFDLQGVSKVGGGSISAAVAIAQYDDETLLFDGSNVYSRTSGDEWIDKGVHVPSEFSNKIIQQQRDRRQGNTHVQETGVARVYAWQEYLFGPTAPGGKYFVKMRVEDATTGVVLRDNVTIAEYAFPGTSNPNNQLYDTPRVQCFAVDNYVFVLWQDNGNIYYDSINCLNHTTINSYTVDATRTIVTDLNTSYPVFVADLAVNGYTDDEGFDNGAILVAWRPTGTTNAYSFRYFSRSTAALSAAGSSALQVTYGTGPEDITPHFEAWKKDQGVGNDIFLKCLNDTSGATEYDIVFGTTHKPSGDPQLHLITIKANLSAYLISDGFLANQHLLSGTAGTLTDGGTVHVWVETSNLGGGAVGDTVVQHRISHVTRERSAADGNITTISNPTAWNSSITSDAFRYPASSGKLYLAVSQVNDISLTRRSKDSSSANLMDNSQRGLNNNIVIISSDDQLMAAAPTGSCATCLTSEWIQRAPVSETISGTELYQIRRNLYSVQRVIRKNANTKYIFGASKFVGYEEYDPGVGGRANYKDNIFGISLCELDFDPDRPLASIEAGRSFAFTGGFLSGYDKSSIFEQGFVVYPAIQQIVEAAATGDGLPVPDGGDDIEYKAIYEWADANGNVHRSHPSVAESFIPSNTHKKATIFVYPPSFSRKPESGRIKIVLYRTEPGGGIFYRIGSKSVSYPAEYSAESFEDDGKNLDITANEQLYTVIGRENDFMGSCNDLIAHRGRAAVVRSDDVVAYSKPIVEGEEIGFNESFSFVLPADNSKVVGIESNLDHLLIFSEENAYFVSGEGPTALGEGGFTNIRVFAAGQGARKGSAHVDTPIGVFYQAERGIYLVRRDLSVVYHGAPVEDSSTRLLVGATLVDSTNEVRFLLSNSGTASGSDYYLIYNYYFQKWALWTVAYTSSAWQVGEVYNGTAFLRATADGKTYKQTSGVFQDDNSSGTATNYSVAVQTGFIAAAGLLHAQRVYRGMLVGDYVSDHTLSIRVSYDYNLTSGTAYSKSITSSNDNPMLVRMHLDQQKCRSVSFKIELAGSGECAKLDAISLEVGRRKSSFKLESARTL